MSGGGKRKRSKVNWDWGKGWETFSSPLYQLQIHAIWRGKRLGLFRKDGSVMREGSQHGNIASHCYKYQSGTLRNYVSLAWPKAPFVFKSWFCFMDFVQVFNFRWGWSGNWVVIVTKHGDFPQKVTSTSVSSNPRRVHVYTVFLWWK